MKIELTRFRVKEGKSPRVDAWMQTLKDNIDACIETLEGEKMCVEAIFREQKDGQDYLYWFSVQGEGGINVADSHHKIDKKHVAFAKECLDREPGSKTEIPLELFMKAKRLNFETL